MPGFCEIIDQHDHDVVEGVIYSQTIHAPKTGNTYKVTVEVVKPVLPCPFCGGQAKLHSRDEEFWYVACLECGNQTIPFHNGRDVVIDRWNTRVN